MLRSDPGRLLREMRVAAQLSSRTGIPLDEVLEMRSEAFEDEEAMRRAVDRREFLRRSARFGIAATSLPAIAALAAACTKTPAKTAATTPRIAIVGAGLAGMTTAYRLTKAGHNVTVYEGSERIGGRTHTIRDFFPGTPVAEACGESINSSQHEIRDLADELGVELEDTNGMSTRGKWYSYFKGKDYPWGDFISDYLELWPAIKRDAKAAGPDTTYDNFTPAAQAIDQMSLDEWLDENVPGGLNTQLSGYLQVAEAGEWGLDGADQSPLNLIGEAITGNPKWGEVWGDQDWRWTVKGGNDLIATTIADRLPEGSKVLLDHPLAAVRKNSDDTVTLSFEPPAGGVTDITADIAIITIPSVVLRGLDISRAGFDDLKTKAITNSGTGTNARGHIQFAPPVWERRGESGGVETDLDFQGTWAQYPGDGRVLQVYTGGSATLKLFAGSPYYGPMPQDQVDRVLADRERFTPGISAAYSGKAHISMPVTSRWRQGSYSCPRVGEYTSIMGVAKLPSGNIHFAGEHTETSNINIGFMNGGVASGERVSKEVLAKLT